MRGKIKRARLKAERLHGASATFVSLVDEGANETPFTLVKSANGATAMTIKKRGKKPERKSHKAITPQRKSEETVQVETVIAKMVFDGELFETEADVQAHLDDAEWDAEGTVITKNDEGDWEVRIDGVSDDDFLKIAKVETEDDGVTAYVGQREVEAKEESDDSDDADDGADEAQNDADEQEDDPVQASSGSGGKKKPKKPMKEKKAKVSKRQEFIAKRKAEREKSRKFDSWRAYVAGENTLAKSLEAGMEYDYVPPGYYDVQAAFNGTIMSIIGDDELSSVEKRDAIAKASADYADVIAGLDEFFSAYTETDEETMAKSVEASEEREAIEKWAIGYADFVAGDSEAPAQVQKAAGDADVPATFDYNKLAKAVGELVSKAVEPLVEQVEGVTDTVEAIASRRPTKKAADAEELAGNATGEPKATEKKGANTADSLARIAFG